MVGDEVFVRMLVADVLDEAGCAVTKAGAQILWQAHPSVWGGYSGYFSDLDNHL